MNLHPWGNYSKATYDVHKFEQDLGLLKQIVTANQDIIPFGNGRSYGDSALNKKIIHARWHHYFLDFDERKGLLTVQSVVLLSEILDIFVPRGWFLKITPGTKFITVGGAIASDVHGKNHHKEGCFSECLAKFSLMLADGAIVGCSRDQNPELFHATCGGMGLTGVILDAQIRLTKIKSQNISQKTVKTKNLEETFAAFETYGNDPYSVAWIDCCSKGKHIGRSLLTAGDFCDDGDLAYQPKPNFSVPFYFPSFVLNKYSASAFNWAYYHKVKERITRETVDIDTFFYPLDAIQNWNRIYGRNGFTQYQFVLPKRESFKGMEEIICKISEAGKGSFLAVLKLYGQANANYLSFPMEGYGLALDFKVQKGVFELLDKLDKIILKYNGRIYLAKDVRVKKEVYEKGYPQIHKFREIRKRYRMMERYNSFQSQRVGI